MTILVLGGNGFIGRHFVSRLFQDREVSHIISMDVAPPKEKESRLSMTSQDGYSD